MRSVKTIDWILRGALAVLLVAFVFVVGSAVYVKPTHVVVAGEQAPPFRITADNGRRVSTPGAAQEIQLDYSFPPCVASKP